jgi:putative FmdB family regulatory protein
MPIYEYRCEDCRRRVSVLVARMGQEAEVCPRCGGARLTRLWSRFALARSDEERAERLLDSPELANLDENDPKAMAQFLRRMGKEMGDELGEDTGAELDQAIDELESGKALEDAAAEPAAADGAAEPAGDL